MAVYDTEENKRTKYTLATLQSLFKTVDFKKHRMIIVDNNSCKETKDLLTPALLNMFGIKLITLVKNVGTAEGINMAWRERKPGENVIKMDNDVVIHNSDWVDDMEKAIAREPKIGIIGLKRKDCMESPDSLHPFYQSKLKMLPHKPGESWIAVEEVKHVMGTCQMYSDSLVNKIGFLYQPRLYGFDDSLAAVRSNLAGFVNVFLPHIEIDHVDPGDTPYQKWKEREASIDMPVFNQLVNEYKTGRKSIYYNPFDN